MLCFGMEWRTDIAAPVQMIITIKLLRYHLPSVVKSFSISYLLQCHKIYRSIQPADDYLQLQQVLDNLF